MNARVRTMLADAYLRLGVKKVKDLCLLKVHHIYQYFRKVTGDDAPGGCTYEPANEKQESTHQSIALEDIQEKRYPLYD